jgi:hypothetical protein
MCGDGCGKTKFAFLPLSALPTGQAGFGGTETLFLRFLKPLPTAQ